MTRRRGLRCVWPLALVVGISAAQAQEVPEFEASAFEKKPYELGGYVQLKQESFALNRDGAFYKLNFYGEPQRDSLDRTTITLQPYGKVRYGIGTFDFRLNADAQRDQLGNAHDTSVFEAAYSLRPSPGITVEAGKRALRWGKGYAWNPIAFVERPKDPNDPLLAREGFVMADADLIASPGGALQTVALTPVLLPVSDDVNSDFGESGHVTPAAKLYLLYRDTDIDFAWQGQGSRPARFGADFSRNLRSNFEIHGEWARIPRFARPVTDSAGTVTVETGNATSYLLGLRYLTEHDTTYIAEYYRNGTGYSDDEFQQFYDFVDTAFSAGSAALIQKALTLGQGSYGRPNAGEEYLYFRAQQKDALGIVYFQPAITAMVNVQDHSYQLTPELFYTGISNLELRARLFLLQGGSGTDFGEKQVSRRLEIYGRYYF
jgi:hypothetical protein